MRWTTAEIASAVGVRLVGGDIVVDRPPGLREIDPSSGSWLFVPSVAERDGHDFVPTAIGAGAAATFAGATVEAADAVDEVASTDDALTALGATARDRLGTLPSSGSPDRSARRGRKIFLQLSFVVTGPGTQPSLVQQRDRPDSARRSRRQSSGRGRNGRLRCRAHRHPLPDCSADGRHRHDRRKGAHQRVRQWRPSPSARANSNRSPSRASPPNADNPPSHRWPIARKPRWSPWRCRRGGTSDHHRRGSDPVVLVGIALGRRQRPAGGEGDHLIRTRSPRLGAAVGRPLEHLAVASKNPTVADADAIDSAVRCSDHRRHLQRQSAVGCGRDRGACRRDGRRRWLCWGHGRTRRVESRRPRAHGGARRGARQLVVGRRARVRQERAQRPTLRKRRHSAHSTPPLLSS